MDRITAWGLLGVAITLIVLSCGGSRQSPAEATATRFLPERIAPVGWIRTPEMSRFTGDSLYEYIDGAAEMYHKYGFVELNVAIYHKHENEIVVDLYRFADADGAFGMYTTLRPDERETVDLGAEGFCLGPSLLFTRGEHMVSLTGYDESEGTISAIKAIAREVDSRLPGTAEKPEMFLHTPREGRIGNTEKVFAESFLGQGFLTDVYTVAYARDTDTLTLFVSEDESGKKFLQWSGAAAGDMLCAESLPALPVDAGKAFLVDDRWHGRIIVGHRAGKLLGIVGYRDDHNDFLVAWLNSLP